MSEQVRDEEKPDPFWVELDSRFRAPLLAYFTRRVQDRAEAEDLTQEVFLRLVRQAQHPRSDAVQAYVFVTAANLLKDWLRNRATHRTRSHRSLQDVPESSTATPALIEDRTPERVLVGRDTLKDFVTALEGLGERTRDIFILARIEHMHQGEIAKLFGISVSAVEKQLIKALNHLGARLAPP